MFLPTESGSLPMFLELSCTSECLITKKKNTTFVKLQTYNVFNCFKRKHPVNYCSSPSLAKDYSTNASGDGVCFCKILLLLKPKMGRLGRNSFLLLTQIGQDNIVAKPSSQSSRVGLSHPAHTRSSASFCSHFLLCPDPCVPQS